MKTLSLMALVCSAAAAAALAGASTTQASDRANARHASSCQRLRGHDLAPARSVKLYRRHGSLIGCVLPRGPIRHIADRSDIPDKSYSTFKLGAVVGGFVLLDQSFNNAHISGTRTVVYHVRTAHQSMIAADFTGDASGPDDHFEAPVAFIDGRGRAVAALVSTKPGQPQVKIARFPLTGGPRILDQGSAEDISPRSLTRVGNMVTWLHSGVAQSAPFARLLRPGAKSPTDDERSRPMITLNVLYPNRDGATFDMDYYLTSHIPMLQRELGSALKGCIVEQGLGGRDPGAKAEFAVLCHLRFDSVEAYHQAMGPVGDRIRNDVANYSSEAPIVQLSDVKVVS